MGMPYIGRMQDSGMPWVLAGPEEEREMEYRYAIEKEKPVVAFLHGDPESIPSKRTEESEEGKRKLQAFRDLVKRRVCKEWRTTEGLGSVVSRSLVALRKRHPAVGWIRGDQLPETTTAEILELRKKIEKLEGALDAARTQAPAGSEKLAQGSDRFEVKCASRWKNGVRYADILSWDEILYLTLPVMMAEASEPTVAEALARGVAPMSVLVEYALPLCKGHGVLVAWKGKDGPAETQAANNALSELGGRVVGALSMNELSPPLPPDRWLVTVEKMRRTPGKYPRRVGVPAKQPL